MAIFRKMKNWTQLELSIRTNITRDQISRIERGKAKPTLKTIELLAGEFNIPTWLLLEEDETYDREQKPSEYEEEQVLQHLSSELRRRELTSGELRIVERAVLCLADPLKKNNNTGPDFS